MIYSTPKVDLQQSLSDLQPSLGDVLSSSFVEAVNNNPTTKALDWLTVRSAPGKQLSYDQVADLAKEKNVILPDVPDAGLTEGAANLLIERRSKAKARQSEIEAGKAPVTALIGGFAGSIADPLNLAVGFLPVVGAARYAGLLRAETGLASRVAAGALEGAVQNAALEPANYLLSQELQDDYAFSDSLANVTFGGVLGGGIHLGMGLVGKALDRFTPNERAEVFAKQMDAFTNGKNLTPEQAIAEIQAKRIQSTIDAVSDRGAASVFRELVDQEIDFKAESPLFAKEAPIFVGESKVEPKSFLGEVFDVERIQQENPKLYQEIQDLVALRNEVKAPQKRESFAVFNEYIQVSDSVKNAEKSGLTGEQFKAANKRVADLEAKIKEIAKNSQDYKELGLNTPTAENVKAAVDFAYAKADRLNRNTEAKLQAMGVELEKYTSTRELERVKLEAEKPVLDTDPYDDVVEGIMKLENEKASAFNDIDLSRGKIKAPKEISIIDKASGVETKFKSMDSDAIGIAKAEYENVLELAQSKGISIAGLEDLDTILKSVDETHRAIDAMANCVGRGII